MNSLTLSDMAKNGENGGDTSRASRGSSCFRTLLHQQCSRRSKINICQLSSPSDWSCSPLDTFLMKAREGPPRLVSKFAATYEKLFEAGIISRLGV